MEFPVSLVFFVQLFFFSVELPLTLSEPVGLVTVTELVSLVLTWSWTVSITFFIIRPFYRNTNQWKHQREQWHGAGRSR